MMTQIDEWAPEPRRLKILYVTPDCLAWILRDGASCRVVRSGLPLDSRVVRYFVDQERQQIGLVVESEAYSPVLEGSLIPTADNVWLTTEPEGE